MRYRIVQLGNVASHAHENSLGGQLKGPKPDFLEPSFPGLVIHNISGKGVVGLKKLSAMIGIVGHKKKEYLLQPTGHPSGHCQRRSSFHRNLQRA